MNESARRVLELPEIWVYLSGNPLSALFLTLLAYQLGLWCYKKSGQHPFTNPVLIAVLLLAAFLQITGLSYQQYFEGAQFVHFLLGTATVALAVPIYQGLTAVKGQTIRTLVLLSAALLVGGAVSIGSALGTAYLLGANLDIVQSLWAKSVTAPIAMGVSERIGASPTLTALFAIVTGILGAAVGSWLFNSMGLKRWWVRGFTMGLAAHGIGTARAFSVHPEAGRYASLGMGLHGIFGALLIPWVYGFFAS
ncbi:MAG: LrgB family protein [Burkholderiales bacterium]|jgi:predicted murein hydrolase (TIGR00659 family)|uniref:LrgB family protein n=1 Tax=Limnobacter sp. TaxID=2003368 RepID=UPI0039599185|nr:LrgB family protein [Burkholderiales bacterium]